MKVLLCMCSVISAVTVSTAGTVGYWRFESGAFLQDSSGNGNGLTEVGNVSQVSLPGTGNGSGFPTTIPQTGASNGSSLSFDDSTVSGFTAVDSTSLDTISANGTFTLEAYISTGSSSASEYIVNQYDSSLGGSSERSFSFQTNAENGLSIFLGRSDLQYMGFHKSTDNLFVNNRDYYVAVTYDVSINTSTFYWQDLSPNPAVAGLQSETGSYTTGGAGYDGTLGNPNSVPLTIGHRNGSSQTWDSGGLMDEVRISNTVLGQNDLLVSIPEPSTLMLSVLALAGGFFAARRRK